MPEKIERVKPKITFGEGVTKQSFKDDCDINIMLKKYQKTKRLPDSIKTGGIYADFSSSKSLQEAYATVELAKTQFMLLPAEVRKRFGHKPEEFLKFVEDPANNKELIELGLAEKVEDIPENTQVNEVVNNVVK